MSGPDRIFAWPYEVNPQMGQWTAERQIIGEGAEYVRVDRLAALPEVQAMIADAETRALDSVTTLHRVIADIRAATVGYRPMLSELAQALVSWRDEAVANERDACARLVDCGCDKSQKTAVIEAENSAERARACGQYNCGAEDAAAIRKRGEGRP